MKVDPWRNLASVKMGCNQNKDFAALGTVKMTVHNVHNPPMTSLSIQAGHGGKIDVNVPVEPLDSTSMCLDDESNNTPCFGGVMI